MEPVWNPYEEKIVWNPTKIFDLVVYGTCMEPLSKRNKLIPTWKRMEPVWNPYKTKIVWNPTKTVSYTHLTLPTILPV